jgi:hypothetical protein
MEEELSLGDEDHHADGVVHIGTHVVPGNDPHPPQSWYELWSDKEERSLPF